MSTEPTLRTKVTKDGQRFVDEPIQIQPKASAMPSQIGVAVAKAFGEERPKLPEPVTVGHERVELRWIKPDGKGGLVPKYPNREKK